MLVNIINISGVFFLGAIASLIGAVFSFIFIPKTKDKSMYELETMFVTKSKIEMINIASLVQKTIKT